MTIVGKNGLAMELSEFRERKPCKDAPGAKDELRNSFKDGVCLA